MLKLNLFQDNLEAEAEVLLDPNTLSEDGTVALNTYSVSENAKYLAVGLSSSGSDWVNIKVIRIADKTTEPDSLSWVRLMSFYRAYYKLFSWSAEWL